jgi:3(or 17)beta-hydroxysteroid dehydrogenase
VPTLERKVALVTGGASGLGKAIAERLARDGAAVAISDLNVDLGTQVAKQSDWCFFRHDVASENDWKQVIGEIELKLGKLDILVNNAGILATPANPEHTQLEDWKTMFSVNVDGVFLGCRAGIGAMRRAGSGAIVNISSVAGLWATPYATAYGASKATVAQLTKSVAQHCLQQRLSIRCNSVHPGDVLTPLLQQRYEAIARERGVTLDAVIAGMANIAPMGGFTMPEDVAAAVAFLVSDESRRITGAELLVDGGLINCASYHVIRNVDFPT